MDSQENRIRLSDRIVEALKLALDQEDIDVADCLTKALELSITRKAGGGEFVERRDYPAEIEHALAKLKELRKKR